MCCVCSGPNIPPCLTSVTSTLHVQPCQDHQDQHDGYYKYAGWVWRVYCSHYKCSVNYSVLCYAVLHAIILHKLFYFNLQHILSYMYRSSQACACSHAYGVHVRGVWRLVTCLQLMHPIHTCLWQEVEISHLLAWHLNVCFTLVSCCQGSLASSKVEMWCNTLLRRLYILWGTSLNCVVSIYNTVLTGACWWIVWYLTATMAIDCCIDHGGVPEYSNCLIATSQCEVLFWVCLWFS